MGWGNDLRYALRMLARDRSVTAVIVLALALGIGANTTVFTLVNAVLFKPLPFPDADRIVVLNWAQPSQGNNDMNASLREFLDVRAGAGSFDELAAADSSQFTISDAATPPERIRGAYVSANSLGLIGARPMLGRDFLPADEAVGAAPVVLIGYGVWTGHFAGDRAIVGHPIRIDQQMATVIGVMPRGFRYPLQQDLWRPLVATADRQTSTSRNLMIVGRLRRGVARPRAQAEMTQLAQRLQERYPKTNTGVVIQVKTFNEQFNGGQVRIVFLALLGAVGCVLLVACANVSNLLLARAEVRRREIAVRAALGASRTRIVRQLLLESVLLAAAGGVAGLGLALAGVHAFALAVANVGKPYWIDFSMDFAVLAYLTAICMGTGVLFGLYPALQASKVNLVDTLKESTRGGGGGRRAHLFTGALVIGELALSLVLLIGAGLMIRSFYRLYGLTTNLPASTTLAFQLELGNGRDAGARQQFTEQLLERLRREPGVSAVAVASAPPLSGASISPFALEGRIVEAGRQPAVAAMTITPDYFKVVRNPLLRGRDFTAAESEKPSPVAIVNQRFATEYLSRQEPLGARVRLDIGPIDARGTVVATWLTVVGVSPDIRQNDFNDIEAAPVIYIPYSLRPLAAVTVMASVSGQPSALLPGMRRAVQELDPNMALSGGGSLDEIFAQQRWPYRVFGTLFAVFAGFALLLAAIGLYAVISYGVVRRTGEIGLRVALGATRMQVLATVLRASMAQLGLGLALGVAGAWAATRVLSSLLVGISATDPLTFAALTGCLAVVGIAACLIPAHRATNIDPLVALRYE